MIRFVVTLPATNQLALHTDPGIFGASAGKGLTDDFINDFEQTFKQ
jgi:hypothetical protein